MASTKFFFLGFEVDADLRSRLEACDASDRGFLEDPEFLEQIEVDQTPFMGRRLPADSVSLSNIEDAARNVVSLVARVAPGWRKSTASAVLCALEEEVVREDVLIDG